MTERFDKNFERKEENAVNQQLSFFFFNIFHSINPFPQNDTFWRLWEKKPFENMVGKGEIACTSNFSFSNNIFYSIKDRTYHF